MLLRKEVINTMDFYPASICLNGHIVSSNEANSQKFCSLCGKQVISICPHCKSPLHGTRKSSKGLAIPYKFEMSYYCDNCSNPFPWTENIINSAVEILSMDEDLPEEQKELLKSAIPDLIVESPNTTVAVARYSKYIDTAKIFIRNGLYQLFSSVLTESIISKLFPQNPQ